MLLFILLFVLLLLFTILLMLLRLLLLIACILKISILITVYFVIYIVFIVVFFVVVEYWCCLYGIPWVLLFICYSSSYVVCFLVLWCCCLFNIPFVLFLFVISLVLLFVIEWWISCTYSLNFRWNWKLEIRQSYCRLSRNFCLIYMLLCFMVDI